VRAVEVENLSIEISGIAILQNVSLSLGEGEVALVTGPCGSGKSTMLKALAGVILYIYAEFKVSGNVKVFGLSPVEAAEKGLVAYVPQDIYTFFISSDACEELEILGLSTNGFKGFCGRAIETLSDGELYKLLTHIAIGSGARLLLLDEPTSHLDSESLREVVELLKRVAEERRVAIVIADHRVDELKSFVDVVVELGRGVDIGVDRSRGAETYTKSCCRKCRGVAADVKGLVLSTGERILIKELSFEIPRGSALGIVGRNGVGKTMLLKVLAGLAKPSSGSVHVEKPVFYIPQKPIYWFSTGSVREELELYIKLFGRRVKVEDVAELFQLRHLLSKSPYTLSVGEARRLAMALAFIASPTLLLIDEPMLGLDKGSEEALEELLKLVKGSCGSAVVASHSKRLARLVDSCIEVLPGAEVKPCA
jgi:energy-coupling factor transport system ATP-binding protein